MNGYARAKRLTSDHIVFVSSRIQGFEELRKAIKALIDQTGYLHAWTFEELTASPDNFRDEYRKGVDKCTLFILIGSDDESPAVIEELELALQLGKRVLAYLRKGHACNEIRALLRRSGDDPKFAEWSTEEELLLEIEASIHDEAARAFGVLGEVRPRCVAPVAQAMDVPDSLPEPIRTLIRQTVNRLCDLGDFDGARDALMQARSEYGPDKPDELAYIHLQLANVYRNLGDAHAAMAEVEKGLQLGSSHEGRLLLQRAVLLVDINETGKAIDLLRKLQKGPFGERASRVLGYAYCVERNYEDAAETLTSTPLPDDAAERFDQELFTAIALAAIGKEEAAIRILRRLRRDPHKGGVAELDFAQILLDRAEQTGSRRLARYARRHAEAAYRIVRPSSRLPVEGFRRVRDSSKIVIARTLRVEGDLYEAEAVLKSDVADAPMSPAVVLHLAAIGSELGRDPDTVRRMITQSVAPRIADPEHLAFAAHILLMSGFREEFQSFAHVALERVGCVHTSKMEWLFAALVTSLVEDEFCGKAISLFENHAAMYNSAEALLAYASAVDFELGTAPRDPLWKHNRIEQIEKHLTCLVNAPVKGLPVVHMLCRLLAQTMNIQQVLEYIQECSAKFPYLANYFASSAGDISARRHDSWHIPGVKLEIPRRPILNSYTGTPEK